MTVNESAAIKGYIKARNGNVPLGIALTWTSDNPYCVRMAFHNNTTDTAWEVSRDLLRAGNSDANGVGMGDIAVRCWGREVHIRLRSAEGGCVVVMDRLFLAGFLRRTYNAVPAGAERMDIDAELAELLADG